MKKYVLVINPGSTSTKVALFQQEDLVVQKNLTHDVKDLSAFEKITDQFSYRQEMILKWLDEENVDISALSAVVGRGGLLKPMPSGTYKVTQPLINDLEAGVQGDHASNLGGILARCIADKSGVEAFIVDPVAVDEFHEVARISGMPEIVRKSLLHALNVRAIAHRVAKEKACHINDLNLVVAHLGGGISVVPMEKGKMIDANNANEMGPFSPERTGGLPVGDLVKMCFSQKYTYSEIKKKIRGQGGLVAYLGTNDAREVMKRIEKGDKKAQLVFDAMGYQIAKEIGAMSTVLKGKVDAVVLTGGVAYCEYIVKFIQERVKFIAPVIVKPGEDEMEALNEGVLRVFRNEEIPKIYEEETN